MTHGPARPSAARRDPRSDDRGFIMVAMLVAIAVAAVWMGSLLPSWRQQAIREKEAELIFRGEQYARAIFLYTAKNNGRLPANIDQLVSQHYLRKKYLDPITGKDFVPLGTAAAPQGAQASAFAIGGISGVRSTSTDTSIKIYYNQQVYSQWPFDWQFAARNAGAGVPVPGARGGTRGETPTRGGRDGTGGGARDGRGGGARDGTGGGNRGGRGGPVDEVVPIQPNRGGAGGGRVGVPGGGGRGF